LQSLSKRYTSGAHTENEGDVLAVCDLADDLRDAIVEYQVSTGFERHTPDISLIKLQFSQQEAIYGQNCKLIVSGRTHVSRKRWRLIDLCRI